MNLFMCKFTSLSMNVFVGFDQFLDYNSKRKNHKRGIGFAWQGLGGGGYRIGYCKKLLEVLGASLMSGRANATWLQDGPATDQGQTLHRP